MHNIDAIIKLNYTFHYFTVALYSLAKFCWFLKRMQAHAIKTLKPENRTPSKTCRQEFLFNVQFVATCNRLWQKFKHEYSVSKFMEIRTG